MISYMNKFHIWKFHIWNHEIMISYMIWSHIWKFHIWNHDFIYDLVSHMNISYMNSWFHIWFGFTYENFIYEMVSSYMKSPFHIWNGHFIYEIICEISVRDISTLFKQRSRQYKQQFSRLYLYIVLRVKTCALHARIEKKMISSAINMFNETQLPYSASKSSTRTKMKMKNYYFMHSWKNTGK